ncbi:hypothetical protein ACE6H2_011907 [Prunus campanulata]
MVGLIPELTLEDLDLASKTKISKDPPDPVDPRDLTFADSFLDFESIEDWFKDIPNPDMAETGEVKVEVVEEGFIREANGCEGQIFNVYDPIDCGSEPTVDGSVPIDCGFVEKVECEISEHLSCSIEEELGKVSLLGGCDQNSVLDGGNCMRSERHVESSALNGENGMQSEIVSRNAGEREPQNNVNGNESLKSTIEGENGARSEIVSESSESSSSSSSSSSSDDDSSDDGDDMDEEENEKGKMKVEVEECDEAGEIEEGEIRDADGGEKRDKTDYIDYESADDDDDDEVVAWTDAEIFDDGDEEEDDGGALKGPIRSKNELEVLPPIPPVNVTLEPHHQMMPVGVVLSILGNQAIVEGVQKHNPLNEGSILWITESRSPLGLIDEIFGPVIHPYYVVRYNSESEIPAGIQAGTSVSFVPEFADHVLNNKDVYRKGYDASGKNDEEVSDEAEFSDDEKEAEYRRMQKMTKRGMNDQNLGNRKNNRKKGKNKPGPWKNDQPSPQQTPKDAGQLPPNQHQHHFSPAAPSFDRGYCPSSSTAPQGFVGGTGLVPPFPAATQATGMNATSNGVWTNGMPFQQQNTSFPNGFPNNSSPWPSPYNHQYPYQMPIPERLPFYPQAEGQRFLSGAVLPGGQLNSFAGPTYSQGLMGQHGFNQTTFGIGLQGQPTPGQQLNAFAGPMYPQGMVGQHGFNQNAFGMGLQGQPTHPTLNADQGMLSNRLPVEQNCNMPQPVANTGNVGMQQFNPGASSNRGRRPSHRGGRHFGRGRGRQQSR